MKQKLVFYYLIILIVAGCSKGGDTPGSGENNNGGNNNGGDSASNGNGATTCLLSGISQVNSGKDAESAISISYNSQYAATKVTVYDSTSRTTNFSADFNYATADSVRINAYQYLKLDNAGRVIKFITKSDINNVADADDYLFIYTYNTDGYLVTKNLFINGSKTAGYSTAYTYTNHLLTGCLLTATSSGGQKVLESVLSYDNTITAKNWMYTFPDAMEGYIYPVALNFGERPDHPLHQVITKIYDPASGALLDTWTTQYGNYITDTNGYLVSGIASGDLQQGMAAFYGKTMFYYTCH